MHARTSIQIAVLYFGLFVLHGITKLDATGQFILMSLIVVVQTKPLSASNQLMKQARCVIMLYSNQLCCGCEKNVDKW